MPQQYTVGVELLKVREVNLEANDEAHAERKAIEYFEDEYPGAHVSASAVLPQDSDAN